MKSLQHIIIKGLVILLLLFVVSTGFAQQINSTKQKPKIALVLSGGGAKGLAHIGVIKVLEEYGIKPDIITGTSMGSIVGSLYAAGYSVEELTAINNNADWELLLTDDEQLERVAMNEKKESNKYLFKFAIRDKKVNLPAGLIEGQHLEAYFSELFWPLPSNQDFNELPIPFHCMSVDMVSGKTIEHQEGDIVKSIRASMSIPTVFSPVQMDSLLLVDGGVSSNFPVQEAIDMGAEIVIGVYVGYKENIKANDLSSMTDVLQRSIALAGIVDSRTQSEKCDVLIVPDLGDLGASDFLKGPRIQELGEQAARKHAKELSELSSKYKLSLRPIAKIEQPEKIILSDVRVANLQFLTPSTVISQSGFEKGDTVSQNDIKETIEYMHGTRNYRKLSYSLKKNKADNTYILTFDVKENPRAKFNIAPNYDDDIGVGIVTNWTLRNILAPSSRFLFSLNIAENPGLTMSFDKKLGKSQHFISHFFADSYSYKLPYYVEGDRLGHYKLNNFEGGYGIHYAPGLNHLIGVNAYYAYNRISPNSDFQNIYPEADFENHRAHEWAYTAFYKVNSTNDLYFPKKGIDLEVSFSHAFHVSTELELKRNAPNIQYFVNETDEPYLNLYVQHNWYKTFAQKFVYNFGISGGFNSENEVLNGMFMLGGEQFNEKLSFKNFAGYNFAELFANNFTMLKSSLNVEVSPGLYLGGTVNVVNIGESYDDVFDNFTNYSLGDYTWGYSLGVKYASILGPIQLLVSDNNKDGETRFHFSVGFPF